MNQRNIEQKRGMTFKWQKRWKNRFQSNGKQFKQKEWPKERETERKRKFVSISLCNFSSLPLHPKERESMYSISSGTCSYRRISCRKKEEETYWRFLLGFTSSVLPPNFISLSLYSWIDSLCLMFLPMSTSTCLFFDCPYKTTLNVLLYFMNVTVRKFSGPLVSRFRSHDRLKFCSHLFLLLLFIILFHVPLPSFFFTAVKSCCFHHLHFSLCLRDNDMALFTMRREGEGREKPGVDMNP